MGVSGWARSGSSRRAGFKLPFHHAGCRLLLAATAVLLGGATGARAQLPAGWQDLDIGSPSLSGSASWVNGAWSVSGGGADIGNTSDQFNFAYATSSDSAVILAQIFTVQETDDSAKAGVMFRDNNTAGAMFALVAVTPDNGVIFEWRNTTGGSCSAAQIAGIVPPIWVELVCAGTNFTGYYSPDGLAWTPIAQAQTIPMNSLPLAGLAVSAHNNALLCQATFNSVVVSNVPPPPPPSLGIFRQLWTNLNSSVGNTLAALTNTTYNPNWPNNPDPAYTKIFTTFETEINSGQDYYGQQLRTFVVPPTNGNYVFWIASDDTSDLFVSSDETPAHKALVAYLSSWTPSEDWSEYASQQSAPVYLQAGCRYYVEALMQQGNGGDNLSVRWQLPNGVFEEPMTATSPAGTWMIPYDGTNRTPGIYLQSGSFTLVEGQNASFFVLCTNRAALSYRWRLNGANLSGTGATNTVLTLTNVTIAANNGQVYSCVVTKTAGAVTSAPITLTVLADIVPPAVQRAANVSLTNFVIVFTKPVEAASATNSANYVFTNGLPVTAASLSADTVTITLTTAPLVYGSNYCLVINNVRDRASVPNTIAANTLVRFTAMPYADLDIGNPPFGSTVTLVGTNGLDVTASGSDIGGASDQFAYNYQLQSGNFDVCTRLAGLTPEDTWAKAGWMARETLVPGARFAATLATPAMSGCFFEWRDPASSTANSAGAFPANYPNTWLRLQRSGNTFNGYASFDGQTWVLLGSDTISMPTQIYLGLAVSSHNSALTTLAQFLNIANLTNAVSGTAASPHEPIGPCSRRTPIVISEIMYKPAPRSDGLNLEFLELYNSNPWFQDISGYQLTGVNMTYTFPPGTILAGGAYLVVAASPQSIQSVYGITNVMGPYTGTLKHVDSLQLSDAVGGILLTVPYSNVRPWPVAADGTGHSIVLANPTHGEGDPRAWDISDVVGGSPGLGEAFHPSPLRNVVINEVLAHSENPAVPRFVELYNHSNQTNDLSGCILTDDTATNKCVLPSGTLIGPRGFLSFNESQLGFVLNGAGETVYLLKPDRSRVLDALQFEAQADGVSYGRWPDGGGDFYPLAARTPGTNNSLVWVGDIVINEFMYKSMSGSDDDQYIELYNQGTNPVSLANWQFTSGITFTIPAGTTLAPDSYLVIASNQTNLLAKYTNLNAGNTLGNWGGRLSHHGERVALAMPQSLTVSTSQGLVTNQIYVVQDEVTYGVGGRWGQWADGGGSSLELLNPNSNHRLAYNWGDSDETGKSVWTNIEFTGTLDNGANYGSAVDYVQVGLLDVGECLVDNLEVRPGGTNGANIVTDSDFESGLGAWSPQGDHVRSSLETTPGLGGYPPGTNSLHLRSSDGMWTLADYVQGPLSQTTLASGQTATMRLKARWLRGWPEVLLRLRGNWLETTGRMPVPANLGTPGQRNSRYVTNAGPAIYEVKHSPALPAADQAVVVTAQFHSFRPFQATLRYRVDTGVNPTPSYVSVPMVDDGTGGDAVAGDGVYSATIPGQAAGGVVAFLVQAQDAVGTTTLFPADLKDNAGVPRECVVGFGDPIPTGSSFSHHHVFITQNWANRWAQWGGVSHEFDDGTWVDGGGRIVYDWQGRYAGSPYHQYTGSPVTTVGGMHWMAPDDDMILGVTSLNKQHVPGNGPLDDDTIQREQACYWMAQQIGLYFQNRRYYVFYVNGNRHAPLMEDSQTPDADFLNEYFSDDSNGVLYKNHAWFEGDVAPQAGGYMNFANESWSVLGSFTTTINGVPDQYKLARYRWMWWIRQYPESANDFSDLFALIDAANLPTSNPAYYEWMEALVDTEQWMRWSAIEHATGDWDSFFTQNQWNMYNYKPTMGKWTALKWDWNITLGSSGSWGSDTSQLFNVGANDPVMGTFQNYVPYRRAYLRAFQDIANLAMNNARVNPLLEAKYAIFAANGLTTTSYGITVNDPRAALEGWIGTMHNSLLSTLTNQGVANLSLTASLVTVSNNLATLSGTAPLGVKTIWVNGVPWPLTWPSVTTWQVTLPLVPGTNVLSVVGVNIYSQPVAGASDSVTAVYHTPTPSPAGQIAINEIMYSPPLPGAQYVELYNTSTNFAFDMSGWQLDGLSYTFPPGSLIGPNSFLVLAADRDAFANAYGVANLVFDTFAGTLPSDTGTLSLVAPGTNAASNLFISRVRYSSAPPWPTNGGITGCSLQLIDPRQDTSRVCNWTLCQTNSSATNGPQWEYVTITGTATKPILLICMHAAAGDCYIDDMKLVQGSVPEAGANLLTNGDFETALSGPWNLSSNMTESAITTSVRHSGKASLHVVSTSFGDTINQAIWENTAPIVTGGIYTLSFWYSPTGNGQQLLVRLSGSSPNSGEVYTLQSLQLPPPNQPFLTRTPDATNSVATNLPPFPPLWLNELQANNLTGITNSAGQHTPWLELYNAGTNTLSLEDFYLANNYTNLAQWAFPTNALIAPGQFQVIFADAQTNLSTTNELHTSFALDGNTGSLALSFTPTNSQVQVLDYLDYTNLPANYSYGSLPDGQCITRQQFFRPTPGGTNDGTATSFIAYYAPGSVCTQDFNTLPNPGATSVNTANPVTINGITYSLANPYDFAMPAVASGANGGLGLPALEGWFGLADPAASIGTRFGATDGDQTTGGQISFGLPNSTNRALGLLATSTTGFTAFGARFLNDTTNTLNCITLQFTGEVWRQSDLPKTLAFSYYIDPSGTATFWTNATAALPALNVAFPTVAGDTGGVAVDGTQALNQTNLVVASQLITNWPPGAALWLVWTMADPTGKAQGLGIDNLSFSASTAPPNTAPVLAPIANQLLILGQTLSLTASATDTDLPPQTLTFSLGPGAPEGATIGPASGQLSWTPTNAPATNTLSVIVTDNGIPSLSATQSFTVTVLPPPPRPQLGNVSLGASTFSFSWPSAAGYLYSVQYKTDLTATDWTTLDADQPGTGSSLSLTVGLTNAPQCFYRVIVLP